MTNTDKTNQLRAIELMNQLPSEISKKHLRIEQPYMNVVFFNANDKRGITSFKLKAIKIKDCIFTGYDEYENAIQITVTNLISLTQY